MWSKITKVFEGTIDFGTVYDEAGTIEMEAQRNTDSTGALFVSWDELEFLQSAGTTNRFICLQGRLSEEAPWSFVWTSDLDELEPDITTKTAASSNRVQIEGKGGSIYLNGACFENMPILPFMRIYFENYAINSLGSTDVDFVIRIVE